MPDEAPDNDTTYDKIRHYLVDTIKSVDNVGQVHDRQRWAGDWEELMALLSITDSNGEGQKMQGWMVYRTAVLPPQDDTPVRFGAVSRIAVFAIEGVLAFNDALDTGGQFNDLVDRVMNALDKATGAAGFAAIGAGVEIPAYSSAPCTAETIDIRRYSQVLSHYTNIIVQVPFIVDGAF